MEKTNSVLSYVFIGFISFVVLSVLAGGMFYLGRIYTLREVENEDSNINEEEITVVPGGKEDEQIPEEKADEIEYELVTMDLSVDPIVSLQFSVPKGAKVVENIPSLSGSITYNGASLELFISHMSFPKGIRKYEIIPNSNLETKLYRVTYKDSKIGYITDYEDQDITKCSSPDIENPTLPCGLILKIPNSALVVDYTGDEDNLDYFDLIMTSMKVL